MSAQQDLEAGDFSSWLRDARIALATDRAVDVPCGECTACCTSSYFIHVRAHESQTLARVPHELMFAAPGLPEGTMVLGYDEMGHCPMLRDGACSIYEDRPLTCRTYDCRVFTAAGIAADRDAIAARSRRWAFSHPTDCDREQHAAVQAAARFIQQHAECFPGGAAPDDPAQVAILAIKVGDVFLKTGSAPGENGRASDRAIAAAIVKASAAFELWSKAPLGPPLP